MFEKCTGYTCLVIKRGVGIVLEVKIKLTEQLDLDLNVFSTNISFT